MKSFFFRILTFIVFTCFFYVICVAFVGRFIPIAFRKNLKYEKGGYGFTYSRLSDVEKVKDIDILFLGSSHAYRGFDTRIFANKGYSSFNLGTSAQTPLQTEFLLRTYLDKINPKLIIHEVYPGSFINDGVESSLDVIENTQTVNTELAKMSLRVNNIKTYNFLIYRTVEEYFFKTKQVEDIGSRNDNYIENQGFVERKITYNNQFDFKNDKWILADKQIRSFERILKMIDYNNFKVILVQAPIVSSRYLKIKNVNEIDSYFSGKENYMNYNIRLSLNDTLDFYDSHHLNQNGVKIFNEELIPLINEFFKND